MAKFFSLSKTFIEAVGYLQQKNLTTKYMSADFTREYNITNKPTNQPTCLPTSMFTYVQESKPIINRTYVPRNRWRKSNRAARPSWALTQLEIKMNAIR